MAPSSNKPAASAARRKSTPKSLIITLRLSPKALQAFAPADSAVVKEESPSKESPSSSNSNTVPATVRTHGDAKTESDANTPLPTDAAPTTLMPPPPTTDGPKKKGPKRTATAALGPDGLPKPRGKPGPKKKARLEDGSIDHTATVPRAANGTAAHKLGPKANQGAINAGLRALDRTGKPCRKWTKGGFKLKSFTGVVWDIPRWTAPPKFRLETKTSTEGSASTSVDSSKENKDNSQIASEKSNSGADIEIASSPPAPLISTTSVPDTSTPPVTETTSVVAASA